MEVIQIPPKNVSLFPFQTVQTNLKYTVTNYISVKYNSKSISRIFTDYCFGDITLNKNLNIEYVNILAI